MVMDSLFIVWQHKLIVVEKANGLVTTRKFAPTQGRKKFDDNQESQAHFSQGTCRVLASSLIQDFSSGLKIPHLLITPTNQPASTHITHEILVCSDTSTTTFESCGLQFEIPKDSFPVTEGGTTYHLLDGPTVVWNKKNTCAYCSWERFVPYFCGPTYISTEPQNEGDKEAMVWNVL